MRFLSLSLIIFFTRLKCENKNQEYPKHIIYPNENEPELNYSEYIFKGGAVNEPKPEKASTGGEDALIFSKNFMAVADGVGGWVNHGIDSSKYSTKLIRNIKDFFYKNPEHYSEKPKEMIIEAASKNLEIGSSTLIFATLWKNELKVGFVGDSGYIVFKPELKKLQRLNANNIIYEAKIVSQEQEHAFNFPFQIGVEGDDPRTATQEFFHQINLGDIVLLMSDGVLDNLFLYEIEYHLNKFIHEIKLVHGFTFWDIILNFDGKAFADYLLNITFAKSLDPETISPFTYEALKTGMMANGGKSDDISIVCSMISFPEKKMETFRKVETNND